MKKIRTIDADALKANMFDYAPPEMMWDRGDIEHKIDEMPTIDAIPVEWMVSWINRHPNDLRCVWFASLEMEWRKEQEAQGG